jgi:hypothetical protein
MSTIINNKKKLTAKEMLNQIKNKQVTPVGLVSSKSEKPAAKPKVDHGKVVNYYVEYEDGTVLLAQGKHAHLIYRFTLEAQSLATMHAFAYYNGPGMEEITKEEALKLLVEKGDKNV